MKKFWNWKKKAVNLESGQEAEERILFMNGVIAEDSWFDDDVTPALFKDELNAGTGDITLWINSPGGDCVAAAQIFNMLSEYPGKITVKIDGLAASAASVIAMAGTEVWMSPVSMMMIHNPATVAWGDHSEMKKAMELLDAVKESIINAYVRKTGQSRAKLSHLMDAETWMDANKAVELGFADDILFQKEEQGSEGESGDPGAGRRLRKQRRPVRARLLRAASSSEAHRGSALAGPDRGSAPRHGRGGHQGRARREL